MKVEIRKLHNVFAWSWLISDHMEDASNQEYEISDEEDVCGICRASYNATCPACKYPGDECPLVVGECNHNFHVHCIYRWLDTTSSKGLCPMCRQDFQLKKGLAINDLHINKFKELDNRQKKRQAEEVLIGDEENSIGQRAGQEAVNGILDEQGDVIMEQGLIVR